MALKFNITPTQNCGKLKYTNCSTYCDGDNYNYDILIAAVKDITNANLFGNSLQLHQDYYSTAGVSDPATQVKWTFNSLDYYGNSVLIPNIQIGVNEFVLEVTDDDNNVSTCTFKVKKGATLLEWVVIPELGITTNDTLSVQFQNVSYLLNTSVDNTTIVFEPDSPNLPTYTTLPINHTYSSDGSLIAEFSFEENIDGEEVSLSIPIIITEDLTDCSDKLTKDNIESVVLTAISPSGNNYLLDITDEFLNNDIEILAEDFTLTLFESGIWTFQTIVTKVDTNTYVFPYQIKVVIICKEECQFNSMLIEFAEEEINCCEDCYKAKTEKINMISTYISAIKNANACGDLTKVNKFINLIQRLLSNKNCNCNG